jgi:hypothetical protein
MQLLHDILMYSSNFYPGGPWYNVTQSQASGHEITDSRSSNSNTGYVRVTRFCCLVVALTCICIEIRVGSLVIGCTLVIPLSKYQIALPRDFHSHYAERISNAHPEFRWRGILASSNWRYSLCPSPPSSNSDNNV